MEGTGRESKSKPRKSFCVAAACRLQDHRCTHLVCAQKEETTGLLYKAVLCEV